MRLISVIFLVITLTSCDKSKDELLVGKWNEVDTGHSELVYKSDHTYLFSYDDGRTDQGTWRLDGDILYTIEEGSAIELEEELITLSEEILISEIGGMFQTKYVKAKK